MSLLPAKYTLSCWQDATFRTTITVLSGDATSAPLDLSGYTSVMNLRANAHTTPVYTLDTTSGQITLGGAAGTISLFIPSSDTLAFPAGAARLYDLSVTAANGTGDTTAILYGSFRILGVA